MLKVTVAEVQRDVIKQLGIDLNGSLNFGTGVVNFNTDNPFSAVDQPLSNTAIAASGALTPNPADLLTPNDHHVRTPGAAVSATIRAMERAGVIRTLAEPTLTAISGESATFLAGGEFPIPAASPAIQPTPLCQRSIDSRNSAWA